MYFIIYLIAAIVLAFIIGAMHFHEEGEFAGFITTVGLILIWPLALIALPPALIYLHKKEQFEEDVKEIENTINFGTYEDTRERIASVSTQDLKKLLKAARSGVVELKASQIEIVKRELIDRLTENGLLK